MSLPSWSEYKATYRNGQTLQGVSDAQGSLIFNAVVDIANRFCGFSFSQTDGTRQTFTSEKHDGDGSPLIKLRTPPIASVTSVALTYDDGTTQTLDSTEYRYEASTGFLYRLSASDFLYTDSQLARDATELRVVFPKGFQNVSVTYTGGFTSSDYPDGLRHAIYETVDEKLWHVGIRGTDAEPASIEELIRARAFRFNPYRRVVV